MTSDGSDRLFEVGGDGAEPFEEDGLRRRTDFQSRAPRAGADFKEMAIRWLISAGAEIERLDFEIDDIPIDARVRGLNGRTFLVIIRGTPYEHPQSGFRKTDTLEKAGFRAVQLARCQGLPVLLVTSDLPDRESKAGRYLAKLDGDVWDFVAYRADLRGFHRLRQALAGALDAAPPRALWRAPVGTDEETLFGADQAKSAVESPRRPAVNLDEPKIRERVVGTTVLDAVDCDAVQYVAGLVHDELTGAGWPPRLAQAPQGPAGERPPGDR